jgi:diadenosine tetraphosphate (Ap4A) HIT family hydrolase
LTSHERFFCYTEQMKATIFETDNFLIQTPGDPFIDRAEGGHINIRPKIPVRDRTQLSPTLAIEYMKLSMVVGEALKSAMTRRGVNIGIVNYQDMGNWGVFKPEGSTLHMHIFGRATTATIQKYGEAVRLPHRETGFYDSFMPLNEEDINEIRADIEKLMQSEKYKAEWRED